MPKGELAGAGAVVPNGDAAGAATPKGDGAGALSVVLAGAGVVVLNGDGAGALDVVSTGLLPNAFGSELFGCWAGAAVGPAVFGISRGLDAYHFCESDANIASSFPCDAPSAQKSQKVLQALQRQTDPGYAPCTLPTLLQSSQG